MLRTFLMTVKVNDFLNTDCQRVVPVQTANTPAQLTTTFQTKPQQDLNSH